MKIAAAIAVIVAFGLVHGHMTDRWGPPRSVLQTGALLDKLPHEINGWTATDTAVDERALVRAGAVNIIKRQYSSPAGDDAVSVMVVCGRPGPVSRHPPTVCFVGAGWKQAGAVEPKEFDLSDRSEPARFVKCVFASEEKQTQFLTYWGWSPDGTNWSVPSDPRFAFPNHPWLYKLYITTGVDADGQIPAARQEFIDRLFAELDVLLH